MLLYKQIEKPIQRGNKTMKKFKRHVLTKQWELYTFTDKNIYLDFVKRKRGTILLIF